MTRAHALADRLEQGTRALAAFASALTDAEWRTPVPKDGRTVGVIVHHVASVYPLEIVLAQTLAAGEAVTMPITPGSTPPSQKKRRWVCSGSTARQPRQPSGLSATRSSLRPLRCRSTLMRHSRVSSCLRITPSGTAIITSPVFEGR